jgi:hypothetical protein
MDGIGWTKIPFTLGDSKYNIKLKARGWDTMVICLENQS